MACDWVSSNYLLISRINRGFFANDLRTEGQIWQERAHS